MSYQNQKTLSPGLQKSELIDVLNKSYGKEQLATLKKGVQGPPVRDDLSISAAKYTCITQKSATQTGISDPASIMVGLFDHIPRWKKGSTVKWAASSRGYPMPAHAVYAANQLNAAAEIWNSFDVGVKFEWVDHLEDAAFVLAYGGDKGDVLASAFFPNEDPFSTVFVYFGAFQPGSINFQKEIFLHELGHVLGLRHEFSMEIDSTTGKVKEGGAVLLGEQNQLSVMNYGHFPPTIQASDKRDTKAFYDFKGKHIGGYPLKDMVPDN